MSKVKAISLFSGGLDSICATRLVMGQGIDVLAVKFITPFFGYEILRNREQYKQEIKEKYGIKLEVVDISDDYLRMLHHPAHGFGKYFNPCVDCKIFMLDRARIMLEDYGASFLITGEVLGQRPMSQRRDTLNIIERDSGTRTFLLRPLSAKLMTETDVEKKGLINREKLLDFSGRGRSRQIALAKSFGITDFPSPAGGCILADPILSRRIERAYVGDFVVDHSSVKVADILLMLIGRQYLLPGGGWFILGRDEKENIRLDELRGPGHIRFDIEERPGPTGLLHHLEEPYVDDEARKADIDYAAALIARYARKVNGVAVSGTVLIEDGKKHYEIKVEPVADEVFREWVI